MSVEPRLTVLMPVHNGAGYIQLALDSVLKQTYRDFELLVIDDGSTDDTPAILAEYAARDSRLRVQRNQSNLGLVRSLNRGLNEAKSVYIARMDADDICMPERFAIQVAYLDSHPEVGLLGSKYAHIDEDGDFIYHGTPMPPAPEPGTSGYMTWKLLWMTSVQHPSAMLRRDLVQQHDLYYNADYFTAEDYELWTRFRRHSLVERLPDMLLHYRVHSGGISIQKRARQMETHFSITRRELESLLSESLDLATGWLLFKVMVPGVDVEDVHPGGDAGDAAALLLKIEAQFVAVQTLTETERDFLRRNVMTGLHKLLALARSDQGARNRIRLLILRRSPLAFARLTRDSLLYRLYALDIGHCR